MERPIGVWCYDKNTNELVKREDWTANNVSGGVIVITENQAFRVLPHNNILLQWGSPAAEFCKSVGGYLPSVVELKIMAANIDEINRCMRVMGQPTLPITWCWSNIEKGKSFATSVHLYDGKTFCSFKNYNYYVCAVAAFQI